MPLRWVRLYPEGLPPAFKPYRCQTFLGLSLRKRFRTTSKHHKGVGMVISIQSIQGHTLFSCTVGDLGDVSGAGDVNLHAWATLEGMMNVVRQTGHSSYYVEKGMAVSFLVEHMTCT
jgi:hypothetical protein